MAGQQQSDDVLRVSALERDALDQLASRYGLEIVRVDDGEPITGTFWGEPEAGVVRRRVIVRRDTPVHSVLHELCHVVCMPAARRRVLHRDAGGDDLEEAAVCYLQVVLADYLEGVGAARLMQDMDRWGYSFRLGSTERWFREDADDAREFLESCGLLERHGEPVWTLRTV